jgi:hypothetical protein
MGLDPQSPAGHVEVVDAVVADVAAAEIVPPPPDPWEQVRPIGDLRRGAEPEVEVELLRRLRRLRLADRSPSLAVPGLGHQDLADRPAADAFDRVPDDGGAAALGADLEMLGRSLHRPRH